VEALEDRLVPSYMVMDVPGKGVYLLDTAPYVNDSRWLTSSHASKLAVDASGDVVGNFPGLGLYAYSNAPGSNRGWHQLSPWQASAIAIAGAGSAYNVAASFQGHGTYENTSYSSMKQLTTVVASIVAIDSTGNVLGEFPGHGVNYHPEFGNWQQVTSWDANALSFAGGWAAFSFTGKGVYRGVVSQGSYTRITTTAQDNLFIDPNGDVLMSINNRPMQIYWGNNHWQQLTTGTYWAGMTSGEVGGYFSTGVWTYNTSTGQWNRVLSVTADAFAFQQ
jgi:hypothetical protein